MKDVLIIEATRNPAAECALLLAMRGSLPLVICVDADPSEVVQAYGFSNPIAEGEKLPESIQLFPPGQHSITAMLLKGGKRTPIDLTVDVNAKLADLIKADFQAMVSAAGRNEGPKPYLDFNHEDGQASAWVTEVYWAGEDPMAGGVRAKIEWTKPGSEAIQGKSYRQFSPNFRLDPKTETVSGTTVNMGGLVNRPAFKRIQPLIAKDGSPEGGDQPQPSNKTRTMERLRTALIAAGLISAGATDDAACASEFAASFQKIVSAKSAAEAEVQKVTAKYAALEVEKGNIVSALDAANKRYAETVVAKACLEGRISPKDEKAKDRWVTIIAKNAEAAEMLEDIEPKVDTAALTKSVVDPKTGKPVVAAKDAPKDGAAEPKLIVLAKEIAKDQKIPLNDAIVAAAQQNPEAYNEYRTALNQ